MTVFTYVVGQGASFRVVACPGSRHDAYFEETDNCGGCSTPTPAVWWLNAIDPTTTPVKFAQLITIDIHSALYFMESPDAMFEFTEEGYDGPPMASIGDRVILVPPSSTELLMQDCANWLTNEMDEETIAESGLTRTEFGVKDLMTGDEIEDAFKDLLG
jgi:hypothetical protein